MIHNAGIGCSSSAKCLAEAYISLINENVWNKMKNECDSFLSWPKYIFTSFSMSPFFIWNSSLTCSEVLKWFLWMLQRGCMSLFAGGLRWLSTSFGYPSVFWYILAKVCPCTTARKSTLFFPVVFPVHEAFFMNATSKDKLTGGEKGSLRSQTFPFCLGQGAAVSLLGVCAHSRVRDSFLPPQCYSWHCYMRLPPGVIPCSRTAMGYTGEKDLASL